jgi:hypothetical protein
MSSLIVKELREIYLSGYNSDMDGSSPDDLRRSIITDTIAIKKLIEILVQSKSLNQYKKVFEALAKNLNYMAFQVGELHKLRDRGKTASVAKKAAKKRDAYIYCDEGAVYWGLDYEIPDFGQLDSFDGHVSALQETTEKVIRTLQVSFGKGKEKRLPKPRNMNYIAKNDGLFLTSVQPASVGLFGLDLPTFEERRDSIVYIELKKKIIKAFESNGWNIRQIDVMR